MNMLKKFVLSLALSLSMGLISAPTFAGPIDDINNVLASIIQCENAIETGSNPDEVYKMIKNSLNLSKEINANDNVAAARSRANSHLKKARGAAKKGEMQQAEEHLKAAYKAFENLKKGV